MISRLPIIRGRDSQGAGYYGASRGNRRHNGIDCCSNAGEERILLPGDPVRAMNDGMVTKLGYPYADDLSYRYVQVTDAKGRDHRYFYVLPTVEIGDRVQQGDMLGTLQELTYEGIEQHYHFEVKYRGSFLDPVQVLAGDA